MVSPIILKTVQEFIDYAMIAVMLMIAYYAGKFFFVAPPTKEEREKELEEQREAIKGHLDKRKKRKKDEEDARKKVAEAEARAALLKPAKGYFIRLEEGCSTLREELNKSTEAGRSAAEREIDDLESNLRAARRIFQAALRKSKDDRREWIKANLYEYVEAMEERVAKGIKRNFPRSLADAWARKAPLVLRNVRELGTEGGYLITAIDKFIDSDTLAATRRVAGRAPRPTPP